MDNQDVDKAKEVKGVVEDEDKGKRKEHDDEKRSENKQPKGQPHQQVPQPCDFSTDALDKQLPPTQA